MFAQVSVSLMKSMIWGTSSSLVELPYGKLSWLTRHGVRLRLTKAML